MNKIEVRNEERLINTLKIGEKFISESGKVLYQVLDITYLCPCKCRIKKMKVLVVALFDSTLEMELGEIINSDYQDISDEKRTVVTFGIKTKR